MTHLKQSLSALLALACIGFSTLSAHATSINWSGYTWDVRDNANRLEGPGWPTGNRFSQNGVWVDSQGYLHLQIFKDAAGNWQCAELQTEQSLGFGQYTMMVMGVMKNGKLTAIQNLDKNAVFAMFHYPPTTLGPDGTHEMDIELSYWGYDKSQYEDFMNWSIYATVPKSTTNNLAGQNWHGAPEPATVSPIAPQIHQYYRSQSSILFKALDGWSLQPLASTYLQGLTSTQISQAPMPVHFNLWLNQAVPPTDGQPVEVVVKFFEYLPQK
jgi:hypothetical protein